MTHTRALGLIQVIASMTLALYVAIKILMPFAHAIGGLIGVFIVVTALSWIVRTIPTPEKKP